MDLEEINSEEELKKLKSGTNKEKRQAAYRLGKRGEHRATPILLKMLGDNESSLRAVSVRALGRMQDKSTTPQIIKMLTDSDSLVRWEAVGALERIKDLTSTPHLIERMLTDTDAGVRIEAVSSLGRMGDLRAIPAILDAGAKDYEMVDGFSVHFLAKEAVSNLLREIVVEHISNNEDVQFVIKHDSGQLHAQLKQLSNEPPYQGLKKSKTPYNSLPKEAIWHAVCSVDHFLTNHPSPFAVEVKYIFQEGEVERVFVFSSQGGSWWVETIVEPHLD